MQGHLDGKPCSMEGPFRWKARSIEGPVRCKARSMEDPVRWNPFDGRPDEGKAPFDGKPRSITPSVRPSVPASSHKGGETGPHATKKRAGKPPTPRLGLDRHAVAVRRRRRAAARTGRHHPGCFESPKEGARTLVRVRVRVRAHSHARMQSRAGMTCVHASRSRPC